MEVNRFKYREMAKALAKARVGGVEGRGWRDGGGLSHSSFGAKQQKVGQSQEQLPASPPSKPFGIQEENGGAVSQRNELTPGLGAGEGG